MFLNTQVAGPALSRGVNIALKTTSVWFPQITTLLVKNKTGKKHVSAASSPGPGEKPGSPCPGGQRLALGVTHGVSQPGPSPPLQLPQNAIHRAEMPLSWSPSPGGNCLHSQHQVLIKHSVAVTAVSHLPPHPRSPPEDRLPLPQAEPPPVAALHHQPATNPSPSTPSTGCVTLSPTPKKEAVVPGLFKAGILGWGVLAPEMSPTPGIATMGKAISAAGQPVSRLVIVLLTLPIVLGCRGGLWQGKARQVELVCNGSTGMM